MGDRICRVHPFSPGIGEIDDPLRQRGEGLVGVLGADLVLQPFHGCLVEDEVEFTDVVVDVLGILGLGGHPVVQLIDPVVVGRTAIDVLEAGDVVRADLLNGRVELVLPMVRIDEVDEFLDDGGILRFGGGGHWCSLSMIC